MSETVVFLGAGASYALGLPLTSEILPRILNGLVGCSPKLFAKDQDERDRLRRSLAVVLPGLEWALAQDSQRWPDVLPSVTDVLSSIDYLVRQNNAPAPAFGPTDLSRLRRLLERGIFELLVRHESGALRMEGVPVTVLKEWGETYAAGVFGTREPEHEQQLGEIVRWLEPRGGDRVTLVSTNYDIEVEQALYTRLGYQHVFSHIDFGTSVREPDSGDVWRRPASARYSVLKLHGSLNWLRCDLCDNLYLNPIGPIAYLSFLLADDPDDNRPDAMMRQQMRAAGANRCHCGYDPLSHVIVAPSFVRDVRDPILLEVWRAALDALRRAGTWIIVGYSLPPEDLAIRSMLLRASTSREDRSGPLRVIVVQGSRKEPELSRYRLLFPEHEYFPDEADATGGLSAFIQRSQGSQ